MKPRQYYHQKLLSKSLWSVNAACNISLVKKETFEEYGKFDNYKCCIDSMIQFNFDVFLVNAFVEWLLLIEWIFQC